MEEDNLDTGADIHAGLKAQNAQLIGELRKLKAAQAALEAERDNKATEAAKASGDIEALTTRLTAKHQAEIAAVQESLKARDAQLQKLAVEGAITQAIASGNVLPHNIKPLTAMFKAEVEWDAENAQGSIEGKPITDYVTSFLKSKDGSHYVAPSKSSGTGAEGAAQATETSKWGDGKDINLTDWYREAKADPAAANAEADRLGRPDLKV